MSQPRPAGGPPPAARADPGVVPAVAPETVAAVAPGLTSEEARARLAASGPNVLVEPERRSALRRLGAQLVHLFALLLWAGAALAWAAGMPELAAAIAAVVLVNGAFAFFQEYRADRATEALRRMLPHRARVRRDGTEFEVPAEEVVPGDVLVLAPGDSVAADGELLSSFELRLDESALTGESWPVAPAGRVWAGTFVVAGVGEARVTATGMATRFGRIARLAQATPEEPSPLERQLGHVTRLVAVVAVAVGLTFFVVAGLMGMGLAPRLVFAVGVTVALVPEGLLPTLTLSLALATQRMARRNALVRRLSSVEALGSTTVICTDKTGTLTENELTVEEVWTPATRLRVEGAGYEPFGRFREHGRVVRPDAVRELLRAGLLCNDSRLTSTHEGWAVQGDPTEGALLVLARKAGLHHERELALQPRLAELPFDSRRRLMTTIHLEGEGRVAYVKGAPEEVLRLSMLAPAERRRAEAQAERMERRGLRVLALARRRLPAETPVTAAAVERDVELLGLVGMHDPPRPEIAAAIRSCHAAGIRIVMVTGDAAATAEAVAHRIGLVRTRAHALTGAEVARLSDDELRRILREREPVFARIDPEQKLRLARLLREEGEIVAMTGDGVNDAPALREADVGVAMGLRGTDVAREAADVILLDDNFASVVAAVEEGRAIYANIRRFSVYHFGSNVAELIPFLVWGLLGGAIPLPLVVMQVLAIDLGTDMLPAIALGSERAEAGTMSRPPRPRSERLLGPRALSRAFAAIGPLEGLAGLGGFILAFALAGWRPGSPLPDAGTAYLEATTMTAAAIMLGQVGAAFAMRTDRGSTFSVGLLSNRFLLAAVGAELALVLALIYVPGLNTVFHQAPLGPWHWLYLAALPPLVFGAEEGRKALGRRRGTARADR